MGRDGVTRRQFLGTAVAATVGLAGCSGTDQDQQDRSNGSTGITTISEEQTTIATGETTTGETTTKGRNPLEQTHQAEDLESVAEELERDSVTLNVLPANENAEYTNSIIFDKYNGELNVELDLNQALNQRHFQHPVTGKGFVYEFFANAHKPEWRQSVHQQYIEAAGGENQLKLKEEINWAGNGDKDKSTSFKHGENLDKRIEESGIQDLWYKHAIADTRIDGISSVHNGIKAAAYQSLDQRHGFNTFYWDHDSKGENGDHGLIAATEQPTRKPEETGNQENYTIETNYQVEQQIATVAESNFFQGDNAGVNGYVEHPAEHDYNNTSEEIGMYAGTALQKSDSQDLWDKAKNVSGGFAHHFTDEWFRNPESEPAFNYFDRMNAVAYIAEENNVTVHHTRDKLRFETSA
ncbi:hypothetical protein [Halorussus halobius]|uniref:hypothetical protein n=1 Tax=Halorussus halobius TaxID=1710537 RepID=UPI0010930524|nr:hypothetical protein [Halorussus halobius]